MDESTEGPRLPGGGPSRLTRPRTWVSGPFLGVVLRRVRLRTLGRWIAVGLAVLLPSIAWGVATASAHGNLGPHTALYQITLDHEVTVDVGPLGTLVIDSPVPVLGARVVVREIPREVTSVEASTTLDALSRDLEKYVQLFSGPEATLQLAVRALILDAVRRRSPSSGWRRGHTGWRWWQQAPSRCWSWGRSRPVHRLSLTHQRTSWHRRSSTAHPWRVRGSPAASPV